MFCHDIQKGNDEIIRVEVSEFRDQKYLNIRVWYTDKNTGEYKPTQRGVAVRLELYKELKQAILAAEEQLGDLSEAVPPAVDKPSQASPEMGPA